VSEDEEEEDLEWDPYEYPEDLERDQSCDSYDRLLAGLRQQQRPELIIESIFVFQLILHNIQEFCEALVIPESVFRMQLGVKISDSLYSLVTTEAVHLGGECSCLASTIQPWCY